MTLTKAKKIYRETSKIQGETPVEVSKELSKPVSGGWHLYSGSGRCLAMITAAGHCVAGIKLAALTYHPTEAQDDWSKNALPGIVAQRKKSAWIK